MDELGRPAELSGDRVGGAQVHQWSRKKNREALEVLCTKQTKYKHETKIHTGKNTLSYIEDIYLDAGNRKHCFSIPVDAESLKNHNCCFSRLCHLLLLFSSAHF